MKKLRTLFLCIIIYLIMVVGILAHETENIIFSTDEMEILNLVVDSIIDIILLPPNETIFINRNLDFSRTNFRTGLSQAQIENSNRFIERNLQHISDELWQSLHSFNSQRYIFDQSINFNLSDYQLVIITDDDKRMGLRRGVHFPLLSFSRIGFNSDKTEAIFEINYYFPRAGSRYFIYLQKENNRWKVINRIMIGIS